MNTRSAPSIRSSAFGSSVLTNCGRNAKKKIVSFGLRMLIRMPETITCAAETGAVSSRRERALVPNVLQAM